ncbi:MAG: hypothetical protein M3M99_05375 [Actinomycetota bacterium]|nr:hypothetical protein [Actinomycetota bacterium]
MTEPATPGDRDEATGVLQGPSVQTWLEAFRRAAEANKTIFAEHRGIAARSSYSGFGEGGDHTLVIDSLCEEAVLAELESVHSEGHDFTAITEERGTVAFGDPAAPLRVVIDPIDGSLNARRTVPCHSLSIAVADGDSMADVRIGYVYEFGAGEEFLAVAGQGSSLDGERVRVPGGDDLAVVAIESSAPELVIPAAQVLVGHTFRLRSPGTIAVSLCWSGAGRLDAMFTARPCRSVDVAAGQLIVREAGGHVAFGDAALADLPLDLEARYNVASARTPGDLEIVRRAQQAALEA